MLKILNADDEPKIQTGVLTNDRDEEHRQIQFLEIMEGRYSEEAYGPFCFYGSHVQAVFVSIGNSSSEDPGRIQTIRDFFQRDVCHVFSYRGYIVFLFENTPETDIKRLLENLCGHLEKTAGTPAPEEKSAITLGSRCREGNSPGGRGIRKTCQEAEKLMEDIFFYRDIKYISPEDIQNRKKIREINLDEEVKKLSACIQVIDRKKIRSFFRTLELNFFSSGYDPQEVRRECMELIIEVRSDIVKKFPALKELTETGGLHRTGEGDLRFKETSFPSGKKTFTAIMKLRYLADIIDNMTEACLRLSECLPLLSADSSFQRIISYVKNNYSEELNLETLAQLFNYNCAYLGKRFKEYTGKSFHTYLDMLRIDAAMELLRSTNMKVYEISKAIGYSNTDYFYSKFKKYAGESPLIYKKMNSNA